MGFSWNILELGCKNNFKIWRLVIRFPFNWIGLDLKRVNILTLSMKDVEGVFCYIKKGWCLCEKE